MMTSVLQVGHNSRKFQGGGALSDSRGGLGDGLVYNSGVAHAPSVSISCMRGVSPTGVGALDEVILEDDRLLLFNTREKRSRAAFQIGLDERARSNAPLGPPDLGWLAPSPS